jgi:dTDP-4-amino-4,6-dideoxygalactose transaminase
MRHARHLYSVRLEEDAGMSRDALLEALEAQRIGSGVHYLAVHLHPYYRERYGLEPDDLPVAHRISQQTLSLPLSPKVSDADQDDVVAALRHVLDRGAARVLPAVDPP